ncbi:S-adenosyl-L-methionine-dependent methyltransferase [Hymenopellis radicata]|nr:S-adenosyl-L-methionine-dependent methyltransferase [Hymenopellis radicata]
MTSATLLELSKLISALTPKLVALSNETTACNGHVNGTNTPAKSDLDSQRADIATTVASAAYQLYVLVMPPREILFQTACAHSKSAALEACIRLNVAEHLSEAGPEGRRLSSLGIASLSNAADGGKLARCIRSLCNVHIFKEIKPNVFANNDISEELDSGKSTADIKVDPISKHDGSNGFAALAELHASISCRSSGYLFESLTLPDPPCAELPTHAPVNKAFNVPADMTVFQWLHRPEEEYRRRMFGTAMAGTQLLERDDLLPSLADFDWSGLPQDALVVDVGGGIGTLARKVLKNHPHVRVVVQDMPKVIEAADKVCSAPFFRQLAHTSQALDAHDFFEVQPVHSASVFILKHIVHNWSFKQGKIILSRLAEAATPTTRLLIATNIITLTCHDPTLNGTGTGYNEAPSPLLPNYGAANDLGYALDMCMMNLLNTQAYTIHELTKLLSVSGWRIEKVYDNNRPNNFVDLVQAVLDRPAK